MIRHLTVSGIVLLKLTSILKLQFSMNRTIIASSLSMSWNNKSLEKWPIDWPQNQIWSWLIRTATLHTRCKTFQTCKTLWQQQPSEATISPTQVSCPRTLLIPPNSYLKLSIKRIILRKQLVSLVPNITAISSIWIFSTSIIWLEIYKGSNQIKELKQPWKSHLKELGSRSFTTETIKTSTMWLSREVVHWSRSTITK